ncbi:EFR1 family ferrodoxin [Dethiothermospora halolimnae]|uniref:EFR1 family ferrodoxin n=1 Tax=Dethiothermospora halolimnae TaxID=3114390 RepID=UPI003CCBA107
MKVKIYYFSGTGNTKKILEKVRKVFENQDVDTKLTLITDKTKVDIEEDSIMGLMFPVNANATSPFIWRFIKGLPKTKGQPIFVIYTFNDSAAIGNPVINSLKKKGYRVIGIKGIQMPNHLVSDIQQVKDNEKRFYKGMLEAENFANDLVKGKEIIDYQNSGSTLLSFLTRNTGIPWFLMRLGFKVITDHSRCEGCKMCIKDCPVQNIEMKNNRVTHKFKCDFCMKCMANCPNKAKLIKGNKKIKIV